MTEVNIERVRLLVDALRSGRFEQGKGRLAKDDMYCCLGVACVVAQENGLALTTKVNSDGDVLFGLGEVATPAWGADSNSTHLPSSVQNWYGFGDSDPSLLDAEGHVLGDATQLNDEFEYDFARIADAFEHTFLREATVG
jgi:hypothetical protein